MEISTSVSDTKAVFGEMKASPMQLQGRDVPSGAIWHVFKIFAGLTADQTVVMTFVVTLCVS